MADKSSMRAKIQTLLIAAVVVTPGSLATEAHAADGRSTSIRSEISAYYSRGLARAPDDAGMSHYAVIAASSCLANLGPRVAKSIFTSPEFLAKRTTWTSRVDALYRGVLNREPDSVGRAHYLDQLYSGSRSWTQVVDSFLISAEYGRRKASICHNPAWSMRYTHSLSPPSRLFRSPKWEGCWDIDRYRMSCRDLRGVEEYAGTVPANYNLPVSSVVAVAFNGTYGAAAVTTLGNQYEGCQRYSSTLWRCDYFVPNPNYEIVRHTPTSSGYWLQVLREWASQSLANQLSCSASIVGLWGGEPYADAFVHDCLVHPYTR